MQILFIQSLNESLIPSYAGENSVSVNGEDFNEKILCYIENVIARKT